MLKVGVTGGLCTGKGLVMDLFSELGAAVLDADVVVHEILDCDEDVRRAVCEELGPDIVGEDGRISRRKIGERVFSDKRKLKKLTDIIHPRVKAVIRGWLEERELSGENSVAVVNVPLLIEANMLGDFDVIIVVSASEENQVLRCIKRDGLCRGEALARTRTQLPLAEKEKHADYIVRNDSSKEAVKKQVKEIWERFSKV